MLFGDEFQIFERFLLLFKARNAIFYHFWCIFEMTSRDSECLSWWPMPLNTSRNLLARAFTSLGDFIDFTLCRCGWFAGARIASDPLATKMKVLMTFKRKQVMRFFGFSLRNFIWDYRHFVQFSAERIERAWHIQLFVKFTTHSLHFRNISTFCSTFNFVSLIHVYEF